MKTTNIFYRALCLVLMALCSVCGFAQTDPADQLLKTIVHPSPQSAAYARYGEYPVDHSTGVPKIEIPLYTLNTGDYELPITLSYHASGIKVMDVSGPVGLGWVLNAGGVISRTVCGVSDNESSFYRMFFKNKTDVESRLSSSVMDPFLWNRVFAGAPEYDSESDRYSYNFMGKSGLFRYDVYTNEPFTVPYEPIKIDRTASGFKITDTDGSVYTFESTELCYPPDANPYTSSWYLTQIETGNRKNVINLTYDYGQTYIIRYRSEYLHKGNVITYDDVNGQYYIPIETVGNFNGDIHLQSYTYRVPLLKNISWNDVNVSFKYAADRQDTQKERLVSIEVKDGGDVVRHITLGNGVYFGNTSANYRMKLTDVTIKGDSLDTMKDRYSFTYNGITPPNHFNLPNTMAANTYCQEDYWGYYTGRSTYSMIPAGIFDTGTGYADRSASSSNMKMCSLESITYPTGGSTTFNMEANYVNNGYIGGLRVASIVNKNADGIVLEQKQYEYNGGSATIGISNDLFSYDDDMFYFIRNQNGSYQSIERPHRFAVASPILPLTGWSGSPVFYNQVTEYNGTSTSNAGKTVYYFTEDFESSYPGSEEDDYLVPLPLRFYSTLYNNDEGIVPSLLSRKEIYKNNGSNYVKQQTEIYNYTELSSGRDSISLGVRIGRTGVGKVYYEDINFSSAPYPDLDTYYGNIVYSTVRAYLKKRLLTGKTVTNHETGHTISHTYLYNDTLGCMLPVEEHITNSDGNEYTTRTVYPFMLEDGVSRNMADSNMVDIPIKVEKLCGNTLLSTDHTVYTQTEGMFLPQKQNRTEGGETRTLHTYEMYDSKGNPLYVTTLDGRKFVFLWGYGNRYPVARIEGATYNEVGTWVGSTLINSLKTATGSSVATILGNIRNSLSNRDVLVTTYTYSPGVGVTSMTAPNENTTYYEYDSFGRLVCAKDDNGKAMETYSYHLMTEETYTPTTVTFNITGEGNGYVSANITCQDTCEVTFELYGNIETSGAYAEYSLDGESHTYSGTFSQSVTLTLGAGTHTFEISLYNTGASDECASISIESVNSPNTIGNEPMIYANY